MAKSPKKRLRSSETRRNEGSYELLLKIDFVSGPTTLKHHVIQSGSSCAEQQWSIVPSKELELCGANRAGMWIVRGTVSSIGADKGCEESADQRRATRVVAGQSAGGKMTD